MDWLILTACKPVEAYFMLKHKGIVLIARLYLYFWKGLIFTLYPIRFQRKLKIRFYFLFLANISKQPAKISSMLVSNAYCIRQKKVESDFLLLLKSDGLKGKNLPEPKDIQWLRISMDQRVMERNRYATHCRYPEMEHDYQIQFSNILNTPLRVDWSYWSAGDRISNF